MFAEVNADEAFRKQMLEGGFALLDFGIEGMDDFMQARQAEYYRGGDRSRSGSTDPPPAWRPAHLARALLP